MVWCLSPTCYLLVSHCFEVLRKDLWAEQGWPLGSVVAQACHASSAAIWLNKARMLLFGAAVNQFSTLPQDDETTALYCSPENIENMTKVLFDRPRPWPYQYRAEIFSREIALCF